MNEMKYFAILAVRTVTDEGSWVVRKIVSELHDIPSACVAAQIGEIRASADDPTSYLPVIVGMIPVPPFSYELLLPVTDEQLEALGPVLYREGDHIIKNVDGLYRAILPCIYTVKTTPIQPPGRAATIAEANPIPKDIAISLATQDRRYSYDELSIIELPTLAAEIIHPLFKDRSKNKQGHSKENE